MRILVTALLAGAVAALSAAPVAAQGMGKSKHNALKPPTEADQQAAERKKQAQKTDEAYQKSLKQIPANQKPVDPWGNMR